MTRHKKILQLAATIRRGVANATGTRGDAWLLHCRAINRAAADLVRLTREEAAAIVDAKRTCREVNRLIAEAEQAYADF